MDRQVVRYQRDDQEFGRAIGFFDATYALALTLLVTTLDIAEPSSAWAGLSALWDAVGPQFLSFGISFAVIASYWLAHHRLVRTLGAIDQLTIVANLVPIASIVLIPFSTNAVGDPGVEDQGVDRPLRGLLALRSAVRGTAGAVRTGRWWVRRAK